jgi:hypothetical protein
MTPSINPRKRGAENLLQSPRGKASKHDPLRLEDAAILLVTVNALYARYGAKAISGNDRTLRSVLRSLVQCVRTDALNRCALAFEDRPRTGVVGEPYDSYELADFLANVPTPSGLTADKDVRDNVLKLKLYKEVLQQSGLSKSLFDAARQGLAAIAAQWMGKDLEAHFATQNQQLRVLWLLHSRSRLTDDALDVLRRGITADDLRQIEMRQVLPSTFLAPDATNVLGYEVLRCALDIVTAERVIPLMGRTPGCILPHMLGAQLVGVMNAQCIAIRLPCMEVVTDDVRRKITDSHAFTMLENLYTSLIAWGSLNVSMTFSEEEKNLRVVRIGGSSVYAYVMPFPERITAGRGPMIGLRQCFAKAAKTLIGDKLDCGVWRGWGAFLRCLERDVDGGRIPPFPRMVATKPLTGDGSRCPPTAVTTMEVELTRSALLARALEPDYRDGHGFQFSGPIDWPLLDFEEQDASTIQLLGQFERKPLEGGLISTPKDVTFSGEEEGNAQGQGVYAALIRRKWDRILAHAFILVATNTYILAPLHTLCTVESCKGSRECIFRQEDILAQIGIFFMETLAQGHRPPAHLHPSVVACLVGDIAWERVLLDCAHEGLEQVRSKDTVWPLLPYPNVGHCLEEGSICEDPETHDLVACYPGGKPCPLPLPGWVMPACAFPCGGKEFVTKLDSVPMDLLEYGYLEQLAAAIADSEPAMDAMQSGMKKRPGVFTLLRDSSLCAVLELMSLPACIEIDYEILATHLTIKLHSGNHTTSPDRLETLTELILQRLREDRALRLKLVLETCETLDLHRAIGSTFRGITIVIAEDGALVGTDTHTCWFETTLYDVPNFEDSLVVEMNKWGTRQTLDGDVAHASP